MIYTVTSGRADPTPAINFAPNSVIEEVLQNIQMIITTVRGTVPLDRNFGVSDKFVDRPVPAVNALVRADVFNAIETYESRAEVVEIFLDYDESGKLTTKIEVEIP
jgi:hypothetical protein